MKIGLRGKLLITGVLLALIISAVITYISYRSFEGALIERYTTIAANATELGASFVDGDRLAGYLSELERDEQYEFTLYQLNQIKESFRLEYLYVHIPHGDEMVYVYDARCDGEDLDDISELGESDALLGSYDAVYRVYTGSSDMETMILDEEYGYLATIIRPIYGSSGQVAGIIGADISMDVVRQELFDYIVRIAIIMSVIVFIFILVAVLLAQRYVIRPLLFISDSVRGFVGSGEDGGEIKALTFTPIDTASSDELGTLAQSVNTMAADVIRYAEDLTVATAEKERIGAELDVATQIQASMLPSIFPPYPDRDEFELFASMLPAKEVGGDFYDFFLIDDNTLAVVMADVSGKGVPAALFMVIAKTLIKNNAQKASSGGLGKSPKDVFEAVNNILRENNKTMMFVTAFMGYLDIPTGKLTYVNAGHNLPLIRRSGGGFDWLREKSGKILAVRMDSEYVQYELMLSEGDILYLYTDGVTEAVNKDLELFGDERLLETVNNLVSGSAEHMSIQEFSEAIKREIDLFADGAEQADDITMLTLRYNGS